MNFFKKLGLLFANAAKKLWEKLTDSEKESVINGSGILAIFISLVGQTPEAVRKALADKLPGVDWSQVEEAIYAACRMFNLEVKTIDEAITALQAHLKNLEGSVIWNAATHGAAGLFSIIVAKDQTVWEKIINGLEYAYQNFIKKGIFSRHEEEKDDDDDTQE